MDEKGHFRVPAEFHAATVFYDTDLDGFLDVFEEPANPCILRQRKWLCALYPTRLTLRQLRIQGSAIVDTAQMFFESYDVTSGQPDPTSELCLVETGQCGNAVGYNDPSFDRTHSNVKVIPSCEAEESWEVLSVAADHESSTTLSLPRALDLEVETIMQGKSMSIVGTSGQEIQRVLVVVRTAAGEVVWTTELHEGSIHVSGKSFTASVPVVMLTSGAIVSVDAVAYREYAIASGSALRLSEVKWSSSPEAANDDQD